MYPCKSNSQSGETEIKCLGMTSLTFLRQRTSSSLDLSCLPWSTNIYVTSNFYKTIDDMGKLYNYLRVADGMFVCKDQSVLLLSEVETRIRPMCCFKNSIVPRRRFRNSSYICTQLVHFSYCGYVKKENYLRHSHIEGCILNLNTYVLLKVYKDQAKFSSPIECEMLSKLLLTSNQKHACLQFDVFCTHS